MTSQTSTAYSTTLALDIALLSMYHVYLSIENLQVAIKKITHTGQGIQYPNILEAPTSLDTA